MHVDLVAFAEGVVQADISVQFVPKESALATKHRPKMVNTLFQVNLTPSSQSCSLNAVAHPCHQPGQSLHRRTANLPYSLRRRRNNIRDLGSLQERAVDAFVRFDLLAKDGHVVICGDQGIQCVDAVPRVTPSVCSTTTEFAEQLLSRVHQSSGNSNFVDVREEMFRTGVTVWLVLDARNKTVVDMDETNAIRETSTPL